MTRRSFHRETEEVRQNDLVNATLDAVAELGLPGATVREVAWRAGVTPGLIRRYFLSKERLVEAAYRSFMQAMTAQAESAIGNGPALARLARLVRASVTAPVAGGRMLAIWAAFIGTINTQPAMADLHRDGYRAYRDLLEQLVRDVMAERGATAHARTARRHAIALNALIDGLWLEISLGGDDFSGDDIVRIALDGTAAILGIDPADLRDAQ